MAQPHQRPGGRPDALRRAAGRGALAGLAGVAAMTLAEKPEQQLTGRPDSSVPGRDLAATANRDPGDAARPRAADMVVHWGTGALLGTLRGVWAATGIRGGEAWLPHTVVRLAFDQTVEDASGAGAPPSTWPPSERVVDLTHKAVYSLVTGLVADRLVAPMLQSRRGRPNH